MSEPLHDERMTTLVDRQLLTYAVQTQIFCPRTGQVLDVRRAVLVTLTLPSGREHNEVMTAAAFDDIQAALHERAASTGVQVEVRDGRNLFSRKKGARR